jgi:hypothetical protein
MTGQTFFDIRNIFNEIHGDLPALLLKFSIQGLHKQIVDHKSLIVCSGLEDGLFR